ncbi:MAG TPA: FecR domain-containing protein, partial [Anaerolineales bacterium]|nr:FecR domain-containing protein [Anaerolineales bacterium]
MTDLKPFSRDGHTPLVRYWAVTFVLLAAVVLAGCAGLKSSINAASQGTANEAPDIPANAKNALLGNLQGTVEIKTGDGKWSPAETGEALESGQQLRTGAFSNVTLTYADGSRTYLGAGAEVAIDALDARTSGARVVQLTLVRGESRHTVESSDDSGSRYNVRTPNGDGSATGSAFTVMVLPNRSTQFWVENGSVSVVSQNVSVDVIGGHTTIIHKGQPPIEPMFRITGEGRVMQIEAIGDGDASRPLAALSQDWTQQNDKVTLCHATGSATNPYVEITVSVQGATNGHAGHSGDIIPAPAEGC